jgi:cytochrome c-type biogenesis protein CcmF
VQGFLPIIGAHRGNANLMAVARPAAQAQFLFVLLAYAALTYAFLTNDFTVENVANNSFSQLPPIYRFTEKTTP